MYSSAGMLLLPVVLLGLDGPALARTWTDSTGAYRIEAEFVDVIEGNVHLRRTDGSVIAVPLDKLSDADRDHVKRVLAESLKTMSQPGQTPSQSPGPEAMPALAEPAAVGPSAAEAGTAKPAARTGRFSTSFSEHSPMAARSAVFPRIVAAREMNQAIGEYQKQLGPAFNTEYFYKPEDETWQVVVPDDYDGSIPYGLFVFVNSSDSGGPQSNWLPVLQKYRLIYVGPDNAGNERDVLLRRAPMALDAVHNISRDYAIDPTRIYISGHSGGGRLASQVALAFADVFTGGQYHVGADEYTITAVGSMGSSKLGVAARNLGRYVFITGDDDMNRAEMQGYAKQMVAAGFRFITYLQIPGHGHSAPPGEWFEKGILALDAPLREAAKAQYEAALKAMERQQWDRALPGLRAAAVYGQGEPFAADAMQAFREVQAKYNADLAAVEDLLAAKDAVAANKQLAEFRKRWPQSGRDDAKRLGEAVQRARATR